MMTLSANTPNSQLVQYFIEKSCRAFPLTNLIRVIRLPRLFTGIESSKQGLRMQPSFVPTDIKKSIPNVTRVALQ